MAFEILIGNQKTLKKTIGDEILAIAYVFHLLTDERIPTEDIYIHNTATGETQDLNQWTGTEKGDSII